MSTGKIQDHTDSGTDFGLNHGLASSNGAASGQSWLVVSRERKKERVQWEEVPIWSGLGSIVLIIGVLFFDHPSVLKYMLLFAAQGFYLLNIILRG